jgi:hypothetical protein
MASSGSGSAKKEIVPELQAFVDARGLPALFFFVNEPLESWHVIRVQALMEDHKFDELDLVINSGGGSIDSAFQIAELLRLHTKKLNACVPFYAKSAATLLCISADEIILDDLAQLGPLDAQVLEGKRNGRGQFVSALNPFKALEQLQLFSLAALSAAFTMIDNRTDLSVDDCMKHAIEFVRATSAPMFGQLNPEKLGEYSRALNVGKEYGDRLLRRFSKLDEKKRSEILEKLVHGYPSHDYIIDLHELTEMGLQAKLLSSEERKTTDKLFEYFRGQRRILECVLPSKPASNPHDKKEGGKP